jgi:hypothetical protein
MRTQSRILNLVAAVIATLAAVIVSAQEPQKQSPEKPGESAQDNQLESKKKEEEKPDCILGGIDYFIGIDVSVTDGNDRPILDLAREDFAIFENGVPQRIAVLTHDNSSSGFSLAFDISDYEPLKLMARQAAWGFVRQIRPTDEVTIPQLEADCQAVWGFAADERRFKSEDEISAATERIIQRLKGQYMMAYKPKNDRYDGSFRNIRVTVTPKDNRKVKVFAKSGYYAVDPEKIEEEKINDK